MGYLEKDVSTRSPMLYAVESDSDLSYAAFKGCQSGAARANVVVCIAQSPDEAVHDIQCYGNVNVDAGIQSGGWEMNHYGNDESEKGDYVLHDEKFVGEIPKWR